MDLKSAHAWKIPKLLRLKFSCKGTADWLTEGENGFLVNRKDANDFANAVLSLIADPEL